MNSAKVIKLPSTQFVLVLANSKNVSTELLCNWRMTILVLAFLRFLFVFHGLACIIFTTGIEKGSAHTWFWRDEDDGGADLFCCLCSLLRHSVSSFVFLCSFVPLLVRPCFEFHSFFFSCISLCIISFLSSSLPYALPLSVFLWLYSRINAIHVSNVLHRGS